MKKHVIFQLPERMSKWGCNHKNGGVLSQLRGNDGPSITLKTKLEDWGRAGYDPWPKTYDEIQGKGW